MGGGRKERWGEREKEMGIKVPIKIPELHLLLWFLTLRSQGIKRTHKGNLYEETD